MCPHEGARVRVFLGDRNDALGVGAGRAGTKHGRDGPDTRGPGCLPGDGGRGGPRVFSGPVGRGVRARKTGRRGACCAGGSPRFDRPPRLRYLGSRDPSAQGGVIAGAFCENQVEVEACFHEALAVSRRQQAKSLELRTATSLARLWQHRGKDHRRMTSSRLSTPGSPRGSIRRTCRMRRPCWTNYDATHPAWTARGAEDIVHTQPAGVSPAQEAARMAALPGQRPGQA